MVNHSKRVAVYGNQLDYIGIVVLMWGSTIPSIYYGFYCDPNLQTLYWFVVSDSLVLSASSFPRYIRVEYNEANILRI
jgi:adiponectin receptor